MLIVLGLGSRLLFLRAFPNRAFWDALQLIHFGELIRANGLAAPGWYWAQFNPGLPMILALMFKAPLPHMATARLATALLTGLLGLIPFLVWRGVVTFRWRLLAGALLALWPGQVFFSGVVVQDNWVLPPAVGLACLAVRRLRSPEGRGWPLITVVLFGVCFAIRQEMLVALAPLAIAAGISRVSSGSRARDIMAMLAALALIVFGLCVQRQQATGRFTIATEHGALGLFGSFIPGAGTEGWIDARPYAAAREPAAARGIFGSPSQLLRLTLEEVERRPAFHALRIASWLPRLGLGADADALHWSVGVPQALPPTLRSRADAFQEYALPLSTVSLALIHGGFVAALLVGFRRRRLDILVLAGAIALKFGIHMIVSPLGRLVLPAIALELLAIPLGADALGQEPRSAGAPFVFAGIVTAAALWVLTPPLALLVSRLDSPDLVGISTFRIEARHDCLIRCELRRGALIGLTPDIATIRSGEIACSLPITSPNATLDLRVVGAAVRVEADDFAIITPSEGLYRISNQASEVKVDSSPGGTATIRFRLKENRPEWLDDEP